MPHWGIPLFGAGVPVAVPDKIFGLTLFLVFVDRGHSLGSLDSATGAAPLAPQTLTCGSSQPALKNGIPDLGIPFFGIYYAI